MKRILSNGKRVLLLVLSVIVFPAGDVVAKPIPDGRAKSEADPVHVLLLVAENYGLNYFLMRDAFDLYGWTVTETGVLSTIPACPPSRELVPPIIPDVPVADIKDVSQYAAVVIPPGAGNFTEVPEPFGDLIKSPKALALLSRAVEEKIPVYATCSGVQVLAEAGVIGDRRVVGSAKLRARFEESGAVYVGQDHPPVIDGGIVTSARGRYYNVCNHMAIATAVENAWPGRGVKPHSTPNEVLSAEVRLSAEGLVWARTLGSPRADGGRALCPTGDGGFLLTGYTFSQGTGDADILVVKTDGDGKPRWSKSLGGAGTEYGYGCATTDDGYLIVGYTTSFGAGSKDVYAVKLDLTGKELWSKTYGGKSWDVGTSVAVGGDGTIYLCGFTHSFGSGEEDVFLVKTDRDGRELWSKMYGGERFEIGNSIHVNRDGQILIGATTGTFGKGNTDFFVIRADAEGREIWSKSYGTQGRVGNYGYDWLAALRPARDGGAVLVGQSGSNDLQDVYVVRIDAEGAEIWAQSFGRSPFYDYGADVRETDDGGFIIVGTAKQIVQGPALYDNQILLQKLDSKGRTVWEKTFGSPEVDWASAMALSEDGDVIVLGHTTSGGAGSFDGLLLKIHPENTLVVTP